MMGIDIFINFIVSYVAGSLPSLKNIFSKNNNKPLEQIIDKCYERAVEKWCANDAIRSRIVQQKYADVNQLQSLYMSEEINKITTSLKEIIRQWAEELKKDEECANYIQHQEFKVLENKIDNLAAILENQDGRGQFWTIKRGLTKHQPVEGYIRRYCSSDNADNDFLAYIIGNKKRHTLADYVIGLSGDTYNKFILYSSAQTGKTTELKELCWELQQSQLYIPICFEVRTNTKLKRDDLPYYQYLDDKEIVVVIDALDEVNGQKHEDLIEEIGGYAYDHPEIKIILSCRSNYRREGLLNQFEELFLEELDFNDARTHIERKLGWGKCNLLIKFVNGNGLGEFIRNPFFLNVLIDAFKENSQQMPKTKANIYRLFIEKSYKKENEEKTVNLSKRYDFDDSVGLLERVALALSLMNTQSINRTELRKCLYDDDNNVEECLRYDLIRCEGEQYSFQHNAFREWLVANYLSKTGLEKAKQFATHPNKRIKPEWYNIIMLWVSMYGKDKKDEIASILDWLKGASLELVIYIDRDMLDEQTRDNIFKGLLLEYKSLGIRMSNIMTHDYEDLLAFGQSEETIRFMVDEIRETPASTVYYADLMCLSYFLNWEKLSIQNKNLAEELFNVLKVKTKEALETVSSNDLSFLYFDNKFFAKKEYVERIFRILRSSNHYEAIRCMIGLIGVSDSVDEHLDYILGKEHYVHNQQEGYTTQVVSRTVIYSTLSKVKSLDGVKKVLTHKFDNSYFDYSDEKEAYVTMMEGVLTRLSHFINEGYTELVNILEEYYCNLFKEHHYICNRDEQTDKLLLLLRKCYNEAGLKVRGRKHFYEQITSIFLPHEGEVVKYSEVENVFLMAGLWMTVDDVKNDFAHFNAEDDYDRMKAGWYSEIPFAEVADCGANLYEAKFPKPKGFIIGQERRKQAFDDFANYDVFKHEVLEMISEDGGWKTHKEHIKVLRDREDGYNQHAYRFIINYIDSNDRYVEEAVIRNIKNKDVYDAFFMKEVARMLSNPNRDISVTEVVKNRCIETAKYIVRKLSNGIKSPYYTVALELMLKGYFKISDDLLPRLLDYGTIRISRKEDDSFYSTEYSLFDYIAEKVDIDTLAPIIVEKLKVHTADDQYQLAYSFSDYIITNQIEEGFIFVLQFALSGFYLSVNILELLIKNNIKIDEIKAATKEMKETNRVFCYSSLVRNVGAEDWVRNELESKFKTFTGYSLKQALRLLLSIGSMKALDYFQLHLDLIKDESNYIFNYNTPNAIPILCYFIKYCKENNVGSHFFLSSILSSLERIAKKSKDDLDEVKKYLRQLIQTGDQFKYLNRYIISFEDKFYASYSGISDITKAMAIVDAGDCNIDAVGSDTSEDVLYEEDNIFISYNWESGSAHVVDYLCFVLETEKIPYKRDRNDCHYLDNIKEFMNTIRKGKMVVVVFSRPYLKSKNCMYELTGIMEDTAFKDRVLPVVVDDSIRDSYFYVELVKFWKEQKDTQTSLVGELRKIDPTQAKPEETNLNEIETIYRLLPAIKDYVDWANAEKLDSLCSSHFRVIIERIKHNILLCKGLM